MSNNELKQYVYEKIHTLSWADWDIIIQDHSVYMINAHNEVFQIVMFLNTDLSNLNGSYKYIHDQGIEKTNKFFHVLFYENATCCPCPW